MIPTGGPHRLALRRVTAGLRLIRPIIRGNMLRFNAEENLVLIYRTHIEHQNTLIFHFLLPSLEKQMPTGNDIESSFSRALVNWGKAELLNYSFISTYHLWEKQIGHIIKKQPNKPVNVPYKDFVKSIRKILKDSFQIDSIAENVWSELEKARLIVNAFKHGPGKSLEEVRKISPGIIVEKNDDILHPTLEIPEELLKNILNALKLFYNEILDKTELDYSNWTKKRQ
jgi:hypothetical protein